jgi:hypothetical protein
MRFEADVNGTDVVFDETVNLKNRLATTVIQSKGNLFPERLYPAGFINPILFLPLLISSSGLIN